MTSCVVGHGGRWLAVTEMYSMWLGELTDPEPCHASFLHGVHCVDARTTRSLHQSSCCVRWRGCGWRSSRVDTRRCDHCWMRRVRRDGCLRSSHITTTSATRPPDRSATGLCGRCASAERLASTSTARTRSWCTPSGMSVILSDFFHSCTDL